MSIALAAQADAPPRTRWRNTGLWTLYALLAVLLAGWAGEWAAQRERRVQVEAIHRTIEVQALGLRG